MLARYRTNATEGNDDYDHRHFLFLVYEYKGGLDRELRRSMMESSIDDYLPRLLEWARDGNGKISPSFVETVAKLVADTIVWRGEGSMGESLRLLIEAAKSTRNYGQDVVGEVVERMEEMVVD